MIFLTAAPPAKALLTVQLANPNFQVELTGEFHLKFGDFGANARRLNGSPLWLIPEQARQGLATQVINFKILKASNSTTPVSIVTDAVPPTLLALADEVIE